MLPRAVQRPGPATGCMCSPGGHGRRQLGLAPKGPAGPGRARCGLAHGSGARAVREEDEGTAAAAAAEETKAARAQPPRRRFLPLPRAQHGQAAKATWRQRQCARAPPAPLPPRPTAPDRAGARAPLPHSAGFPKWPPARSLPGRKMAPPPPGQPRPPACLPAFPPSVRPCLGPTSKVTRPSGSPSAATSKYTMGLAMAGMSRAKAGRKKSGAAAAATAPQQRARRSRKKQGRSQGLYAYRSAWPAPGRPPRPSPRAALRQSPPGRLVE